MQNSIGKIVLHVLNTIQIFFLCFVFIYKHLIVLMSKMVMVLFCLESVVMQPLSHAIFIYITNMANRKFPND